MIAGTVFTGKERDAETGLDYFVARYYPGAQGRFTSPDTPLVDQQPSDPQSWNLFAYVRNNPFRFYDPDGQACKTIIGPNGETIISGRLRGRRRDRQARRLRPVPPHHGELHARSR